MVLAVALGMNFVIVGIENQEEPDYKINIIEIRKLENTEVFQTDVKQMEQMQQESKKGEKKDMCKAIRDLMEDSRAEGRAEGRNEGIREMTENLLKEGVSMEIIAKATGLMKDEIREIEENMLVSQ